MEKLKNLLYELTCDNAPSGGEQTISSLYRLLNATGCDIRTDALSNIYAIKECNIKNAKRVLIDTHIDEVSLIVTEIDKNGFLHFDINAGIDPKILPASEVSVMGKGQITGIISTKPPHMQTADDYKTAIDIKDMVIDIGYDYENAIKRVKKGDLVVLKSKSFSMINNRFCAKSIDNRASVAIMIAILEELKEKELDFDLYISFSSLEEFTGNGAKCVGYNVFPDEAIVLDTTHAKTPGACDHKCYEMGGGPAIGVSPILNDDLTRELISICENNDIKYQIEGICSKTGTNADNIALSSKGVKTALVSLPIKYMHTPSEVVSLEDMRDIKKLILNFLLDKRRRLTYE